MRLLRAFLLLTLLFVPLLAGEHAGVVSFGGVPVPGATVTATQGERRLATVSGPQGQYAFPDLLDGTWTIRVEMQCFQPVQREIRVPAEASAAQWELTLLPREQVQAARDTSGALSVNASAAAGPAKARGGDSDSQTAGKTKGAKLDGLSAVSTGGGSSASQEGESNVVEGALINGSVNNGANSIYGQSPAFGNARRRWSRYSGTLQVLLDNSALNARPYSLTGRDVASPAYSRLTGSATLGGPLRIPRLWRSYPVNITLNYQRTRNSSAQTATGVMPDRALRDGNFSGARSLLGQPVVVTDPTTGLPFSDNVIPSTRISDQAKSLLSLYPFPSFQADSGYNYQVPLLSATHSDSVGVNGSKYAGRWGSFSSSFRLQSTRADNPSIVGFLDTSRQRNIDASASWSKSIRRVSNSLRVQFTRNTSRGIPFFANRENISGNAGITGNNQEPLNWGPPALSFSSGITALSDSNSSLTRSQTASLTHAVQWTRLGHSIKAGFGYSRQQLNVLSQENPRGSFGFTGTTTGSDFADFLLGIPSTISIATGNADKYFRLATMNAYLSDDFRVASGFTVSAGLRWEYNTPVVERYGRLVNLDIASGFSAVAPVIAADAMGPLSGIRYPDSLLAPDRRMLQPRVGLAWRPASGSSLVIRGGYGVYADSSSYQAIATRMAQQPPLSRNVNVSNNTSNSLTLANGFLASGSASSNSFAVDPAFRGGYAQNWEFSLEHNLPADLVMTAGYTGVKGTRALQSVYPNTYPLGAVNPCPACPVGFEYVSSGGDSIRHAAQLRLRRRLRGGLAAGMRYTFAKSIDDAASLGGGATSGVVAQNWLDLRAERSLSSFDQRHVLDVEFQYSTGVGFRGGAFMGGWRGPLFREWTLSGQLKAGSGMPLTPTYPLAVQGTGFSGSLRPDYTGASLYGAPAGLHLNPTAYAAPRSGSWGNAGRNSITGPPQFSFDASLARTVRLSDRLSCDLRVEAKNVLNRVTFSKWDTSVGSTLFGLPASANVMRSVQGSLRVRF